MIVHDRTRLTVPLFFMKELPRKTRTAPTPFAYPAAFLVLFLLLTVQVHAQGPAPEEILASVCSLSLTRCIPLPPEHADCTAAASAVSATAVRIMTPLRRGSGSILSIDTEAVRLVTANHVVEDVESGNAVFDGGFQAPFRVEARDEDRDVALLSVGTHALPWTLLLELRTVTADAQTDKTGTSASPSAGDAVFCFHGSEVHVGVVVTGEAAIAGPDDPALSRDTALSRDIALSHDTARKTPAPTRICCLLEALPGMSGGGVFDDRGYYIGMIYGGEEGDGSLLLVTPADAVLALMRSDYTHEQN